MIIEKCILTLLAALFTALHATPVFAAEAVAMNVSSEKCGINGTVSVDVMLKSGAPLAAAKLELNYDEQLLDFSDISGDNGCVTEHKANGGAVSGRLRAACIIQFGSRENVSGIRTVSGVFILKSFRRFFGIFRILVELYRGIIK